jgi:polar amino acid transport system substrate-binding protein
MRRNVKFATALWLILSAILLPEVAHSQQTGSPVFRTVEDGPRPDIPENLPVKLLADADFAPFSFVSRTGAPAGLSVELAIAACERAGLNCTVEVRPYAGIMSALERGEVDAVIAGPRLDEAALSAAEMTRPYFRTMGRFAVTNAADFEAADSNALAGTRIGVVKDTLHARWLEAYYGTAKLQPFDTLAAAGEALKSGEIDALFGDNLQVIYWVSGEDAAGCCKLLGNAFSDFDFFSRNLAFLVRPDKPEVRAALDYGLDQAQASGATGKIISTYVPLPVW